MYRCPFCDEIDIPEMEHLKDHLIEEHNWPYGIDDKYIINRLRNVGVDIGDICSKYNSQKTQNMKS